jgi:hypothetical protein
MVMIFAKWKFFLQDNYCSAIQGCRRGLSNSWERPAIMFECSINLWEIEGFILKVWVYLWVASKFEIFFKN